MSIETKKVLAQYYHRWMNSIDKRIGFWDFVQKCRTGSTYFDISRQSPGDEIDVLLSMHALGRI